MLQLGDQFPNFFANSTAGQIDFHKWLGESWGVLFSHPADFTPVCTTELAQMVRLLPLFEIRNTKIIAISCDTVASHLEWYKDIKSYARDNETDDFPFPIIEDPDRVIAKQLGMIDKDEVDSAGLPLTARAVFIIDPNKKFRLSILYPATTGRNFIEIFRVIDSMHLTDKHKIATPANWVVGDECMVQPTVPEDQLAELFPKKVRVESVPSGKNYLRFTACPQFFD